MPAAKYFDLILGVDIHWELVPMPSPTPTPLPNPHLGVIWDPMGTAIGMVVNNLFAAAFGEQTGRGIVRVNGLPAANVGTEGRAVLPHIMLPPGTGWAPVPGAPMPMVRPGDPPEPPTSPTPTNDSIIVEGADTVLAMGSSFARAGCFAMSCGEPVRLPSSAILPLPIGAPVLIGGPTSIDILSAVFAGIRTRWASRWLHSLFSLIPWRRLRNFMRRAACFLTGHPVDVANGRVITDNVDFSLPGPLPLTFERVYFSSWANRSGPLGYGWTHALNQAVWVEADEERVIYQDEEGRELTFHTHELQGGRTRPGDELYDPINRLTLVDRGEGCFEVRTHLGVCHDFEPVGSGDCHAMLRRIRDRVGHTIELSYGERGFLTSVLDSAGRTIRFRNDGAGRIVAVELPGVEGAYIRYQYDEAGDLVRAWHPCQATIGDDSDPSWWYQYQSATPKGDLRPGDDKPEPGPFDPAAARNERSTHLLIREIDRNRLTFWFEYDGLGEDARCVRTWGDHGIYDHVIGYAPGATTVRNSLGELTVYEMNLIGQVVGVGLKKAKQWVSYEYDERSLRLAAKTDELGHVTRYEYDDRGNVVREEMPDGSTLRIEWGEHNLPVCLIDPNGSEWIWVHDAWGRVKEAIDPEGHRTRWGYSDGLPRWVERPGGARVELEHDRHKNLTVVRSAGREEAREHDELGRVVRLIDARGIATMLKRNPLGWVTRITTADGNEIEHEYDHEGRLILRADHSGKCEEWEHEGFAVVAYHCAGRTVRYEHDTEERLVAIKNAAGERYSWERDRAGRVVRETGFDGVTRRLRRDTAGNVTYIYVQPEPGDDRDRLRTSIRYDAMGRVVAVDHADGTFERFSYRADGALVRAVNQDVTVQRELDTLGRVVRERSQEIRRAPDGLILEERGPEQSVTSGFGPDGHRVAVRSSLGFYRHDQRDIHGDLTRIEVGEHQPWVVEFEHDAAGVEVARHVPGGLTQRTRYDELQRPTHRAIRNARGEPLVEEQYGWGWADRLEWRWLGGQGTTRYRHDEEGALVEELPPGENAPPIHRARDDAGNLYRTPDRSDCRYGPGGRLLEAYGTTYAHDLDGNLVETRHPDIDGEGQAVTRFAWSGAGSLAHVERPDETLVRFVTDALGRRVRKQVVALEEGVERVLRGVSWLWDGDDPLHELVEGEEPTTWVHEPDRFAPVGRIQGRNRETIFTDYLGAPTEGVTEDGTARWQMHVDLFGEAHIDGDATSCPWRWAGQYLDEETGLAQNRHRYYAPGEGQFVSKDPIGLRGGLAAYAYPADPLSFVDPLGLAGKACTRGRRLRARPITSAQYSVWFQMILDRAAYPGRSAHHHFALANRALHEFMQANPALARVLERHYPGIREAAAPGPRGAHLRDAPHADLTWHHAPDEGVMQLVPESHHAPEAGEAVHETLHPGPRRSGGMALWGGGR